MNIDNFDTWFGVKKVVTGKGEELEQYRDLFEECWNESRAELPEIRKQLEEAQKELDIVTDDMYTEDQVDDIKSEVASDIRDDIEDAIREFKENINIFKNKKIPLVFKEETLLKFILRNMKGED